MPIITKKNNEYKRIRHIREKGNEISSINVVSNEYRKIEVSKIKKNDDIVLSDKYTFKELKMTKINNKGLFVSNHRLSTNTAALYLYSIDSSNTITEISRVVTKFVTTGTANFTEASFVSNNEYSMLSGVCGPSDTSSFYNASEYIAIINKDFVELNPRRLLMPRCYMSSISVNGNILFAGGHKTTYQSSSRFSEIDAFDKRGVRIRVEYLREKKYGMGIATVGNKILIVSGSAANSSASNIIEVYDETLTKLLYNETFESVSKCTGASVDKYALFVGDSTLSSNNVIFIDESLTKHTDISPLSTNRSSICEISDYRFALFVGGKNSYNAGTVYSSIIDYYNKYLTKQYVDDLNFANSDMNGIVLNDHIIISSGDKASKTMESYEYDTKEKIIKIKDILEFNKQDSETIPLSNAGVGVRQPGGYTKDIGIIPGYSNTFAYDKYLTRITLEKLNVSRREYAAGESGKYITISGGCSDSTTSNRVTTDSIEIYDSPNGTKLTDSKLISSKSGLTYSYFNDKVILLGGVTLKTSTGTATFDNIVELIDEDLVHTQLPNTSLSVDTAMSACTKDYLIIGGGFTNVSRNKSYKDASELTEAYDNNMTKIYINNLLVSRGDGGAVSLNNNIIFVGGTTRTNSTSDHFSDTIEIFDEFLVNSLVSSKLNTKKTKFSCITIDDYLIVAGGELELSTSAITNLVEIFDKSLTKVLNNNLNFNKKLLTAIKINNHAIFAKGTINTEDPSSLTNSRTDALSMTF